MNTHELVDRARLRSMKTRRDEMIRWLMTEKKFTRAGAEGCVDNFLTTMQFVFDATGRLP